MLLRTLQTTTTAGDERIDALTLALLVVFIASMAALSLLLRRREDQNSIDVPPVLPPALPEPTQLPTPRREAVATTTAEMVPVWLEGVRFPAVTTNLSDAAHIIEELLAARRDHALPQGVQFYTPELLETLRHKLGVDDAGLAQMLAAAEYGEEPPSLHSLELVDAAGSRMSVRAGYSNGASEIYRLVWREGRWLVDQIERGRR